MEGDGKTPNGQPAGSAPFDPLTSLFRTDEAIRLLDQMGDPVFIHDRDGRLRAVNEAACASLGYSREELLGLSVTDIETSVTPDRLQALCDRIKAETRPFNLNGWHRRKDGERIPVEVRGTHMVRDGTDLFLVTARDMSAHQRAEDVLREGEQRLRTLIENSPFGIAVTRADGTTLMINARLASLLGRDQAELATMNFADLYAHAEERARLVEMFAFRGAVNEKEVRLLALDGIGMPIERHFLVSWQPTRFQGEDAIVSWYQDISHRRLADTDMDDLHAELQFRIEERTRELGVEITERRYAEAALKEANDFLEQKVEERTAFLRKEIEQRRRAEKEREKTEMELLEIIESAPIAVGIADLDGRFLFWNPMFYKLGRQRIEDNGKVNFGLDFIDPDLMPDLKRRLTAGEDVEHVEARILAAEDDVRWVLITMRRLSFEGQAAILTWVFDVTEMKHQADALDEARQAAEASARAKSAFLATMSHEIRTPMNGVITMAEMLAQTRLDGDQSHMLEVVLDSANALLTIIDEILDFSKIEAGRVTLEDVSLSAMQLTERVSDLLAAKAEQHGLDLITRTDPTMPDHYGGDPHRLRQILVNLVGNAIKFTETGDIQIDVRLSDADVPPTREDPPDKPRLVRFSVTDTGIGMTQEQMAGLFQPFSQADSSTQRRFGGTGLGLSICRTLIDLMGGRIGVDSAPNEGACFWFEVPLKPRPERRKLTPPDVTGARVLVVGDRHASAQHLAAMLSWGGAEAVLATTTDDVKSALMHALTGLTSLDAVILDRTLNAEPATRLVDDIVRLSGAEPLPILAIVPRGSPSTSRLAQRSGVRAVIGWPLHRFEVVFTLSIALGRTPPDALSPWRRRESDRAVSGGVGQWTGPDRMQAEQEGCVILVAEDNATNQTVIRMLLERLGLVADMAGNGVEALALYDRKAYGLIITDCHMPEMDGYDLTERIRVREGGLDGPHDTPIIALTADAIAGTARQCLDRGMDDYLTKPIAAADLEAAIQRWLPRALELRRPRVLTAEPPQSAPGGGTAPAADPAAAAPKAAAEGEQTAETPAEQTVLDTTALLDLVGGDATILKGLLTEFLDSSQGDVDATLAALDDEDWDKAQKAAHAVSGAARSAGAVQVGALFKQVEAALLQGDRDTPIRLKPSLRPAFDAARAAIEAL
jgi:PAS domain S-box-containing protein